MATKRPTFSVSCQKCRKLVLAFRDEGDPLQLNYECTVCGSAGEVWIKRELADAFETLIKWGIRMSEEGD